MGLQMNKSEQWHVTAAAAEMYERHVARYVLGPWAPLLVEVAHLTAGERVLDVACGTGVVTRLAAQRVGVGGRVVGVDLNPGMISVARSLQVPVGAAIEWHERNALDLGLPDDSFDVVLCQQGLQFFPDKALALREMSRVLVHGGRIALSVWNSVGIYNSAVGEALARFLGNAAAAGFLASRKVPAKEEVQRLAMEAGFSDVRVRVSRIDVPCRAWINSCWIIWPQHRSHRRLPPWIARPAGKLGQASWRNCGATPTAMASPTPKRLMF